MVGWPEVTGREKGWEREGLCRGLHFAFMEFHRGHVNQKFGGVYKRSDGERNRTERWAAKMRERNRDREEKSAIVSLSVLLTHHHVPQSRFLCNITVTVRMCGGKIVNGDNGVIKVDDVYSRYMYRRRTHFRFETDRGVLFVPLGFKFLTCR